MRGPFAGELNDELAEVGLGDSDAGCLQGRVEMDFLGRHRLRFDGAPAVARAGNVHDDAAGVRGGGGPVDVAAEPLDGGFELFEVAVEVGEGVFLDLLGVVAEAVAVGQGGKPAAVAGQERIGQPGQGRLQGGIGEGLAGGAGKIVVFVSCVVVHEGKPQQDVNRRGGRPRQGYLSVLLSRRCGA